MYIGDLDTMTMDFPKGWALIGPKPQKGNMDNLTNTYSYYGSLSNASGFINSNMYRVMASIPGEDWAEDGVATACGSFYSTSNIKIDEIDGFPTGDISVFEENAMMRVPWFLFIAQKFAFRLRGIYSIFPWLNQGTSGCN